jgi:hypothetical protein
MHRIRPLFAAAVLLLFATPGVCKCANRFIYVDAQLAGPASDGLRIKVEVTPDPNWEPQPEIAISNGEIHGKVYFNTTKSEGHSRDNCSRVPKRVDLVVLNGEHEIDRVRLDIAKDFVKTELRDYKPRMLTKLRTQ